LYRYSLSSSLSRRIRARKSLCLFSIPSKRLSSFLSQILSSISCVQFLTQRGEFTSIITSFKIPVNLGFA
jgi:hypothetical protein